MARTLIIGHTEEGRPRVVPTDSEGNDSIDHLAVQCGLKAWTALTPAEAEGHAKDILFAIKAGEKAAETPASRTWKKADRHLRAAWGYRAGVVDKDDYGAIIVLVDTEWSELDVEQQRKLTDFHGDGSVVMRLEA